MRPSPDRPDHPDQTEVTAPTDRGESSRVAAGSGKTAGSAKPSRPSISFILLVVALIVAGSGATTWALARPEPRTIEIILPTPGPLIVHVTGAVATPGVYSLQPGARVSDAVTAAGGLTEPSGMNMAALLRDGQQLVISEAELTAPANTGSPGVEPISPPALGALLDLNIATSEQLEELPNIGPSRAAAIVSFRDRNGPIIFVDDLMTIDGIGPATVERIRPLVIQP